MSKQTPITQPSHMQRLNDSCLSFRLEQTYISDNQYLFVAPTDNFCHTCFQRRYLTQMMNPIRTVHLHSSVLSMAIKVDRESKNLESWQAYSIADQKLVMSFSLESYEDCPSCTTSISCTKTEAESAYKDLLKEVTTPNLHGLKKIIFSFGFARSIAISNNIGIPNPEFDKLYGDNHEAKILFRMIAADGRHADDSAIGFDQDKDLAELKSMMEYLERYAFMMQLCRYVTKKYDDELIVKTLSLYRRAASKNERKAIRNNATWGINLSTSEIHAIPRCFLFNRGEVRFLRPTSSGFGAHTEFKKSLCSSILELIERDSFVRFWHDPHRSYHFVPEANIQSEVLEIISILKTVVNNETLTSRFFIIESPIKLPVVLITISTEDITRPPSLNFGCGVGFNLGEAIDGALEELKQNAANLVKGVTVIDGFLTRKFPNKIEGIAERMNFYSTNIPREKLKFLDIENPLIEGTFLDMEQHDLESIISRFNQIDFDIYGIDCTPTCFKDKNVYVTRAFSPQLYPIQFEQEGVFKITSSSLSAHRDLPHFFL